MRNGDKNVVQLHEQIEEINRSSSTVTEAFPGFSERLNHLIDLSGIDIPPLDDGRQAHISTLLKASKMAPGDWLKKDKPPKTATLRKLVNYLLSNIQGDHNPYKVEAWLKYGDTAVNSPFDLEPKENQALIPLATTLIVSVAKEIGIPPYEFDLTTVLSSTVEMLSNFKLTHENIVEPVHRTIIAQYIKANPK